MDQIAFTRAMMHFVVDIGGMMTERPYRRLFSEICWLNDVGRRVGRVRARCAVAQS